MYNLIGLDSVFLANSKEAIWQLIPVPSTSNTLEAGYFIPRNNNVPNYSVSDLLINSFEPGDKRLLQWTHNISVNNTIYIYPYKYKVTTASGVPVQEYYMMFRLAEQYLIRAEAEAQKGEIGAATTDIDKIRLRAGLQSLENEYFTINQQVLLKEIMHQRQDELFCEWGNRWFDLKRTEQANSILSQEKQNWEPKDTIFPIPDAQRLIAPNLTQNPGYN